MLIKLIRPRYAAPSTAFSTSFPTIENPLSEGGKWQLGGTNGLDWFDPKVTANGCVASTGDLGTVNGTRYSDDLGHLKTSFRSFSANQYCEGRVYRVSGYTGNGGGHEIEHLLRFSIAANNAHGYEVLCGCSAGGYLAIVRWNGPVTDYTELYSDAGFGLLADDDLIRSQIVGNIITVKKNGSTVASVDVTAGAGAATVWNSGQPGVGFWPVDGAVIGNYGWKNFSADDL